MAIAKDGPIGAVSGRIGGLVFRQVDGETIVSQYEPPRDARSPRQLEVRSNMMLAGVLWRQLPLDAMERWRGYADRQGSINPRTGRRRAARGDNLFRGLAMKYLQVHGGTFAPTEPPTSEFLGDGITLTVGVRPGVGVEFSASGPNSEGVLTELAVQRLAARHYKPRPKEYRTQTFVAFSLDQLKALVPLSPGAYACAIRFVRADTGQETRLVPLRVVEVNAGGEEPSGRLCVHDP